MANYDGENYTESVKIVPELDEKAAADVKKKLTREKIKLGFQKAGEFASDNIFKTFSASNNQLISTIGDFGDNMVDLFDGEGSIVGKLFSGLVSGISKAISKGFEELDDMIGYTRLSNANTRELAFTYGFSGSQAYGFDKAMRMMGFSSEEDLMYAVAQGGYQAEKFNELFEKYTSYFENNYDQETLDQMEQFNVEMQEMKEDLNQTIVSFIVDNKELIKGALQGILDIGKFLMGGVSWLFGSPASAKNAVAAGSYTSLSKHSNVSINNTFNTSSEVARREYTNAGMMTFEQMVKAVEAV